MSVVKDFLNAILYQPLFNALIFLAWLVPGHSIGWAIILLTLIVRLALLPSSLKVLEQQRRMKALQPKVDALKDKHGHDRTAHSKAIMELYASEKVSPLGSCLPILIQFPILIAIYRVFINGLHVDSFSLLYSFTPRPETLNNHWFGLDLSQPERVILPILAAVLTYFQIKQISPTTAPDADQTNQSNKAEPEVAQVINKQMMLLAPIFTYFAVNQVPAALGLYWVTGTLFVIGQQWWSMRLPVPTPSATLKTKGNVTVTIRSKGEKHD